MKGLKSFNNQISFGYLIKAFVINHGRKIYPKLKFADALSEISEKVNMSVSILNRNMNDSYLATKETISILAHEIPEVEILNTDTIVKRLLMPIETTNKMLSDIWVKSSSIKVTIITSDLSKFLTITSSLVDKLDVDKTIRIVQAGNKSITEVDNFKLNVLKQCIDVNIMDLNDPRKYFHDLQLKIDSEVDITLSSYEGLLSDMILIEVSNEPIIGIKKVIGFNMSPSVIELFKDYNNEDFHPSVSGYLFMPEDEIARAIEVFDIQKDTN
jgi:hypothetical protein